MQINTHYHLIVQVPDNVADTLHSSLLDTQVETDKRRLVQEVSTKYRIVNRERETKQVILQTLSNDPHKNVRTQSHWSLPEMSGSKFRTGPFCAGHINGIVSGMGPGGWLPGHC